MQSAKPLKRWIVVFGRAGCPHTVRAVDALVRSKFPFAYVPWNTDRFKDRASWWAFVQSCVPKLQIPMTFPTVIVWNPGPLVLNADGVEQFVKKHDPTQFNAVRGVKPKNVHAAIAQNKTFVS